MTTPALFQSIPALRLEASPRSLAEDWKADLAARAAAGLLSPRTAEAYASACARWLDWLEASGVDLPTPAHVMAWMAALRADLSPASVNAALASVRSLYQWAESCNRYPAIARSVRAVRVRKDEPMDALTPEQVAGLLDHISGPDLSACRDRALVNVLFSTGLRLCSLTSLDLGDLDLVDGVLVYQGKGDREKARRAYLPAGALDCLRHYLQARRAAGENLTAESALFSAAGNRGKGGRLTSRSVRRVVVDLMEKAGHLRRNGAGYLTRPRVLSAHSLRRSAVTAAYDAAGMDAAQTLAGHSDPATTRRCYARVQKGRTLRGLASSMDLGNWGGSALRVLPDAAGVAV